MKSIQTVTVLSHASTDTLSGGWAKRHSEDERLQLARSNSRQTCKEHTIWELFQEEQEDEQGMVVVVVVVVAKE